MNNVLSDEQVLVLQTAEKVGERFGRRNWLAYGRERREPVPLWEELQKSGLTGAGVVEGSGTLDAILVQEGLARAGIPLLHFLTTHFSRVMIARHGTRMQFERFVDPTVKHGKKISFALTEAEAGSETWRIKTFAERRNGGFVLNGQKTYITGARESDYLVVVARTKPLQKVSDKRDGISVFALETRTSGVMFEPLNIELYSPETQYTVYFDMVELGEENLVGRLDRGVDVLFDGLNVERMLIAACSIGLGDHVLRRAAEYGRQRVVFGHPVGSYQGLQFRMARAKARLEAARVLNYEAASLFDAGKPCGAEANMAKLVASEAGLEAFEAAMQTFGGSAYDLGTDIITFYPVIRLFLTAPVANELILSYIGTHVLGLPKSY
uniref:Acyl-CoA dehydrogenase n=2 Tax=Thermoproteati TaxID=1783275 RepID=H5SNS2_9CREN|nr:acyl-CoA dehydrogenase [Candidatus Caldarchaeum subterraneum]BAL57808.1 acyl-CoA dehydrogenase [uncultured crenarchaeote]